MVWTLDVFADFHQFVVHDADANWGDLADLWTEQSVTEMFVQGAGYVAIGTARDMVVPVTVRIEPGEPPLDEERCDRISLGWLAVPSGQIVVTGVTDNGASGGRVTVEPGEYQLRVLYLGLQTLSPDGLRGDDSYVVELWPS